MRLLLNHLENHWNAFKPSTLGLLLCHSSYSLLFCAALQAAVTAVTTRRSKADKILQRRTIGGVGVCVNARLVRITVGMHCSIVT